MEQLDDLFESSDDIQVVSTHREMPDDPVDVVVRVGDKYYRYLKVGSDDLDLLRWMLKRGTGFKALNKFKAKKYDYERIETP